MVQQTRCSETRDSVSFPCRASLAPVAELCVEHSPSPRINDELMMALSLDRVAGILNFPNPAPSPGLRRQSFFFTSIQRVDILTVDPMVRILVIDDDADMRAMLEQTLNSAGHEVALAADGREGVEQYRREPADLVITDIYMPHQEGLDTIIE